MFNRRFACLFLGLRLGVAATVKLFVTQNTAAIARCVPAPGTAITAAQVKQAGAKSVRFILRRNAAGENAFILEIQEWAQVGLGILFFFMILFGERPPASVLVMIPAMVVIVLLQRLILTPHVVSMGRHVEEMPARELLNNPTVTGFHTFQGIYRACEILKLLLGFGVGARLMIRRAPDHSPREFELAAARQLAHGSPPDRRVRERRTSEIHG